MFMDMTIHDFDMTSFLTGDEVDEVYTTAGVMVDLEIGPAGDLDTAGNCYPKPESFVRESQPFVDVVCEGRPVRLEEVAA